MNDRWASLVEEALGTPRLVVDEPEVFRRISFLFSVSAVGIATLIPLGALALAEKNILLGTLDIALAFVLAGNLVAARLWQRYTASIVFGLMCASALFLYAFLSGGTNRSGFVWYFTVPLIVTFGLGSKRGLVWSGALLLPVLALFATPRPAPFFADYELDFKLRFVPAYLVVAAFSFLAEQARERNARRLRAMNAELETRVSERTAELTASNRELAEEIGGRRLADDLRRASEEKYRRLVEGANAIILEWNAAGEITFFNPFAERFFGYGQQEILGRNVVGTIVPPTESSGRNLAGMMREICDNPYRFQDNEHENITRDGRRVWVRWSNSANLGPDGRLVGILSVGHDTTERRRAEEALRRNERYVRSVIDTVDEGFLVLSRDFTILEANRAYCEGIGLSASEILGQKCWQFNHDHGRPCYESGQACPVKTAFETGRTNSVLHEHEAPGGIVLIQLKAFPLLDDSGEVTAVIETLNDVTERRQLEEERLKSQKLEAVGTLAGGIAHDFNNLLQGVFGYVGVAKAGLPPDHGTYRLLDKAEQAIDSAVHLTGQLLTLSKGGRPLKKIVALRKVIENSSRLALSGSGVECTFDIEDPLPEVEADAGQIGQVLQNIVLNAAQAMAGSGTVRVRARHVPARGNDGAASPPGGGAVEIAVADSGTGIGPENIPRIFDPYFTTKEFGSGLGLATSYSIVRNHGGQLDVESEPGRGSVFTIRLPLPEFEPHALQPLVTRSHAAACERGRILLMDDEEVVRAAAVEMLVHLGHEVVCVQDGEGALDAYREALRSGRGFDVVILDLTIRGGVGGEEAIKRLLREDPDVRAIVASGYTEGDVLANFRAHGFKARLRKPYSVVSLQRTLAEVLSRDASPSGGAPGADPYSSSGEPPAATV